MSTATTTEVKVGDIFYASWGYDQTNVNFFEVVGLTPSGKSMKVREIASRRIEGQDRVVPVPGKYVGNSLLDWEDRGSTKAVTKRIQWSSWRGGEAQPYFRFASYAGAYPWGGEPVYETSPYAGH